MNVRQVQEVIGQINMWWMVRHLPECPCETRVAYAKDCTCRVSEIEQGKRRALQLLDDALKEAQRADLVAECDRLRREVQQLRAGR